MSALGVWSGEPLKCVLHIPQPGGTEYEYVAYSNSTDNDKIITNARFSLSDGDDGVNPCGILDGNTLFLSIFDKNDDLNPSNVNGSYYGYINNGMKIEAFISYDGTNWSNYGTWYVNDIDGGFENGYSNDISMSCENEMNYIGRKQISIDIALNEYNSIQQYITALLNSVGVDSRILFMMQEDIEINYSIIDRGMLRSILNSICQFYMLKMFIGRDNKWVIMDWNTYINTSYDITLGTYSSIGARNTSTADYGYVSIDYYVENEANIGKIAEFDVELVNGDNHLTDLTFDSKVIAVDNVIAVAEDAVTLNAVNYTAYQGSITIDINCTVDDTNSYKCNIKLFGKYMARKQKTLTREFDTIDNSVWGNNTYNFETGQILEYSDASVYCDELIAWLKRRVKCITFNDTIFSPIIDVGNIIVLNETGNIYNAIYKVKSIDIQFGEDYTCNVVCFKYGEVE